jgi:hypothetical protein
MLKGITDTQEKQEKPEFKVINELITRLDKAEPPMNVSIDGEKVTVTKGADTVTTRKE